MSTYDLSFVAEVSGVAAGLAKIPKMTEEAAAKSALAQVTASRKAAAKALKEQEDAAKKAGSGWSNAFKGVAKVAGFGDLVEKAGALSGGMEGAALASGVATAGIAAVGVAALGAAAGTVKLMRGARDAIEQIDRLGVTDIITDTQRENIADANSGLDALGVGAGAVEAAIASGLAPAVAKLSESLVSIELLAAKAVGTFSTGALTFDLWSVGLLGALTPVKLAIDGLDMMNRALGISNPGIEASAALVDGWATGLADATVSVQAVTVEQKESLAVSTDAAKAIEQVTIANEKGTTAYKKHAEAVKKAADAEKDRAEAVARIFTEQDAKLGEERFQAEIARAAAMVVAHRGAQDAIEAADNKAFADFKTRSEERTKLTQEEQDRAVGAVMAAASGMADAIGQVATAWQDAHMERLGQLEAEQKRFEKMARADLETATNAEKDRIVMHGKSIDKRIKNEKRMIIAGFVAQQTAAVSAIGMQTAVAVMTALAQLGPVAGAVAGGLIIGTGAIQAGMVLAQKPPKFARGGEVTATLEQGEGIANKRAMADPKFRQHLDSANMGQSGGGGGQFEGSNWYINDRWMMTVYARMRRLAGQNVPGQLTRGMA